MNLNHINISGPRKLLEKEKEFFCNVLGLREGYRPDFSSNGYWLYGNEKAIVHLAESEKHYKNEKQGYLDHVAFQSSGLKQLIQNLIKHDIKHKVIYLSEINISQVFFKSPSGIGIEVSFENEKHS